MKRNSESGIAHIGLVLAIIVVLGAVGAGGYYVWNKNQDKKTESSEQSDEANTDTDPDGDTIMGNGWSDPIASGKGAYSVSFPDGWNVTKDTNSDTFLIAGEAQPAASTGTPANVTEAAIGSDGPLVLLMTVQDPTGTPEGTVNDFTLQNGKENPIEGKKYSYEYRQDTTVGAGTQRLEGDRDYTYVFDLDSGKQLQIMYSVYGSDPRNLVNTVDTLVDTILIK